MPASSVDPAVATLSGDDRDLLLWMSDTLAQDTDAEAVLARTVEALGRRLGVDAAGFAEIDEDGEWATVDREWLSGRLRSRLGRYRLLDFGEPEQLAALADGVHDLLTDVRTDPRLSDARRRAYLQEGVLSHVTVPVLSAGKPRFLVFATSIDARTWTGEEIRLVREFAVRAWATLERGRSEAALRAAEQSQRFLVRLGDRLRDLADPADVLLTAAETLGTHLGANRCGYAEVEGDELVIGADWTDGTVKHGTGRRRFASWGEEVVAKLLRGETERFDDATTDPRVRPEHRPAFEEMSIAAILTVPLVKHGRVVGMLSVHQKHPRVWTAAEVRLVEEVAERTWAALERARAEARLRESERNQVFLVALGDRFRKRTDPIELLRDVNEALGRRLGASRVGYGFVYEADILEIPADWTDGVASVVGRHPLEAFGPDLIDELRAGRTFRMEDAWSDPRVGDHNRPILEAMSIVAAVTVPLIKGGRFVGLMSVHVDRPRRWTDSEVSLVEEVAERTWAAREHARAEAELRRSQALLNAFMINAPVGMYLKDAEGRYLLANAGMERVFGRPAADVIGRKADEFFPAEVVTRIAEEEARAIAVGRAQLTDRQQVGRAGDWTMVIRFPIQLDGSSEPQVGGFAIDVTEQKRAEEALAQSREALYQSEKLTALGSLLAGVSHELNNPLAVVVGNSMLLEEDAEGTALAERASKVRAAAERCARIVQTFLAMARQKPPARTAVDVNEVVESALALTAYGLRTAGVRVRAELAPDLPALSADADQLHQVFANLFINAQHALETCTTERQLTVATRREGADVVVEVSDNGPGVPAEVRRRIFEPFFTTKPQGAGTGLGLSFSHGVVEAHGGRLSLEEGERGATFRIVLPAAPGAEVETVRPLAGEAIVAPPRRTALVVDDEPEIAGMLGEILGRAGFEVRLASGGREGLEALRAGVFDLVLSDLRMPDLDGPALYAWLGVERPELRSRIGFVTGDTLGPNAAQFLAESGRPYLEKPFTPAAVRAFVQEIARRHEEPDLV